MELPPGESAAPAAAAAGTESDNQGSCGEASSISDTVSCSGSESVTDDAVSNSPKSSFVNRVHLDPSCSKFWTHPYQSKIFREC